MTADLETIYPDQSEPAGKEIPRPAEIQSIYDEPDQVSRLSVSHASSLSSTPDRAARVLRLEARTGLPNEYIDRNLDEVESEASKAEFDPEAFRQNNPKLSAWLSENPNHFALAKDDIGIFTRIGRAASAFGSGAASVSEQETLASLLYKDMEGGRVTPSERRQIDELRATLQERQPQPGQEDKLSYVARQTGYSSRQFLSTSSTAATGALAGVLPGMAAGSVIPGVGNIVGGTAGMTAGASTALARYSYQMESAFAWDEFRQIKDETGQPLDPSIARDTARVTGTINAMIELGSDALLFAIMPGISSVIGSNLSKDQAKRALTEQVKKGLATPTIRAALISAGKKMGEGGLIEGIEEALQALVNAGEREVAQAASGKKFAPDDFSKDVKSAWEQGVAAFTGMFFTAGLTHGAPEYFVKSREIARAQETENFYLSLGQGVTESKAFQALPEKGQEIIASLTKNGPYEKAYLDTEVWKEYWQSKGADPREIAAEVLGDTKQYDAAVAAGGDLAIPTERYARKLAPTEHNAFFAQEIRRSPEEMNARESKEFFQGLEKAQQATQEAPQAEAVADPAREVGNRVSEQLRATGAYSEPQIAAYSKVYESAFRSLAQRAEVDPVELFDRYGFQVQKTETEQTSGNQSFQQTATQDQPGFDAEFSRIADEVMTNKRELNAPIPVGRTPSVLRFLGAKAEAMVIPSSVITKAREKHGIPAEVIHSLPADLRDPLMVFKSATQENGLVVLTEHKVNGKPVVAAVYLDQREGRYAVNRIASIHGKDSAKSVGLWMERGLLKYQRDKETAVSWLMHNGLDLPAGDTTTNRHLESIPDRAALIKYEQAEKNTPRGTIQFSKGSVNIDLLKDANLSTFLHETGHFYLKMLGDLAAQEGTAQSVKDDYASVLKWLGVESADQIEKEHHEKFARGFEAYLMEGKAPSPALRSAFARFRVWLTNLYRQMKSLNVELTDEVRGVFDRLLATEDEIGQIETELSMDPMFVEPSKVGMNDAQAAAYLQAREEARIAAEDELAQKFMREISREQKDWWEQERSKVKSEIEAQLQTDQVYKAIRRLRGEEENTLPMKLSRPDVVRDYGTEMAAALPKRITSQGKDAFHPSVLAEMFGFGSAEEFLLALSNAKEESEVVNQLADERMKAVHGDLLDDKEQLRAEAMKAVHNVKRERVLRMELEHILRKNLAVAKDVVRRLTRRIPPIEEVRAWARDQVGALAVREISPSAYLRAEGKAAREAADLFTKGDLDGAFQAKLRELRNHELYSAAAEAKETVDEALPKFRRMFASDEKLAKVRDMDLVNAARAILSAFGLGNAEKTAAEYLEPIKRYDPVLYSDVQDIVASGTRGATDWRTASIEDFEAMREAVGSLWDLSKRVRQMEIDGVAVTREKLVSEINEQIAQVSKSANRPGYDRAVSDWQKTKMHLLGARATLRRVESWADLVDMGKRGPITRYIWEPIVEATARYREIKRQVLEKFLKEVVRPIEKTIVNKDIDATEIGYTFSGKSELLHAVLHTGNDSNLSKLLRGRGWGEVDEEGNLDTSRWDKFIARAWDQGILTKADYDFAQGTWDLLDSLKPAAQRAHKEMYGYYFGEVTSRSIVTPFGTYKGGYVPAVVDPFMSSEGAIRDEREALEKTNNSYMFPTTGRGFTKRRVEAFARPLALDLRYLPSHIDKVLRFTEIEPRVKEVGRLVMDREFRAALDGLDPTVAGDMLVPWLQRTASQRIETRSAGWGGRAADTFFRGLRRRTGLNIMAGSAMNSLQQLTGVSLGATKVDPPFLRNALWEYVRGPGKLAESVAEQSEFMRHRVTTQVMEIQQNLDEMLMNPNKYEKVRDFARKHGYFMQTGTQNIVDLVVWSGAYDQAVAKNKGISDIDAVRMADAAVRLTQGSFAPEDVSRFETGTPFMRAFTMFYSYWNMQANLLGTEFQKVASSIGLRKGAGRLLYTYAFGFMLPAVVMEVIAKSFSGDKLDEDDDDSYLNDILSMFFSSQIRNAASFFPGVGPAAMSMMNRFNDKNYDDDIRLSPSVTMLERSVSAPNSIYKAVIEDGRWSTAIKDTLSALGLLSGMPIAPLAKPLGYLTDLEQSGDSPDNALDLTRGLLSGRRSRGY